MIKIKKRAKSRNPTTKMPSKKFAVDEPYAPKILKMRDSTLEYSDSDELEANIKKDL